MELMMILKTYKPKPEFDGKLQCIIVSVIWSGLDILLKSWGKSFEE